MSFPNVVFIAYNSTVTGSKALRAFNNTNYVQNMYNGKMNIMKHYCKTYDQSKKNEPYFDVIASQISLLNTNLFDNYFEYIPIDLVETGSNMNSFHPSQPDPLIFKMNSKKLNGYDTITRQYLNQYLNYKIATHIYIYGPITDSIYKELNDTIYTHISEDSKLFIHFQGENILDNQGNDGDTIFGMESKGNLFKNSFNYQNGMVNAQKLRHLIQNNEYCEAFTIKNKIKSEFVIHKINNEVLEFPIKNGKTIKNGLPNIYVKFYTDIKSLLNGTYYSKDTYLNLKIQKIYQDMVDKDNATSILYLLIHSINISKTSVSLIGRETFQLTYNNEIIPNYQSMQFSLVPDQIKPDIAHKNIELVMNSCNSSYWPVFNDTNYDLKYDKNTTRIHYLFMCKCFVICIQSMLHLYELNSFNNYVISEDLIANPSMNEDKISLLNEILFYPSLNGYISAINNYSAYLNKYDNEKNELQTITNTLQYKSDIELTAIYSKHC